MIEMTQVHKHGFVKLLEVMGMTISSLRCQMLLATFT